jgi:hypothetical protein
MSDDKALSRDDLFLLLDSYKNTIEMNTTLVEQQKFLMDSQGHILKTQEDIFKKQKEMCVSMTNVTQELNKVTESLKQFNETVSYTCKEKQDNILKKLGEVKSQVDGQVINDTKHDSSMKIKLYTAMGGSFVIIVSLISLIITIVNQYSGIVKLLELISKHLGVSP